MKVIFKLGLIILVILFLCTGCTEKCDLLQSETLSTQAMTETIPNTEPPVTVTEPTPPAETTTPDAPQMLNAEPGAHQKRFEIGDEYMDYYLFVPNNPIEKMPIVVFLHGSVEIGHVELLEDYGIVSEVHEIYGDEFPFLLLLPCTHKPSWTGNGVPETLVGLINEVAETYRADKTRIGITGHSLGSVGTWKMVSLYSDYFSAAVPISCGIDELIDLERCAKVPIMAFAGTVGADEKNYNPAMHKLVDSINNVGGDAKMCVIEGADHEAMVTAAYTKELFDWMLSQ